MNTRSSSETELVGTDDGMSETLWINDFVRTQGLDCTDATLHQDNESTAPWETQGRASCGQGTKHMNIKFFFVKDQVDKGDIRIEHCGTEDMSADFFSEPLQGKKFIEFRNEIMNITPNNCEMMTQSAFESSQECVGFQVPEHWISRL